MRLNDLLADKKGSVIVSAAAMVFSMMFVFSLVYQYARLCIIPAGVRDTVRNIVTGSVTDNFYNTYDGMCSGTTGAYAYSGYFWSDSSELGDLESKLKSELSLTASSGTLEKLNSDGSLQYSISDFSAGVENSGFASNNSRLSVHAEYTLSVPVTFFLVKVPPVQISMSADAKIEEKF